MSAVRAFTLAATVFADSLSPTCIVVEPPAVDRMMFSAVVVVLVAALLAAAKASRVGPIEA